MARRKRGNPVHGWLVLDKPYDLGSTEAVSRSKWLFEAQKAGHAGTLDPLATGILPIAFGEATKTVPYVQDGLKTYRFSARWGVATTTDDAEGEACAESDFRPSQDEIEAILPDFTGTITQRPPAFSAIKIGGQRAYDLAREGEKVTVPERDVTIEALHLVEIVSEDEAVLEAVTGKGTYVRALVRDIAEALGTVAHVSSLRRTAVGPFTEEMAVTFREMTGRPDTDRLTPEDRAGDFAPFLIGVEQGMMEFPQVSIDRTAASRLFHGNEAILAPAQMTPIRQGSSDDIEPILAMEGDAPVAICRLEGMKLKPVKVFNL
ncbi:MAG: tRNA pseudouridine(55) synthase TruB [Pseudomonadota bacterium]